MAKIDNLTDFLTDLADGIREVEGTQEDINPQDFRSRIESFIKEIPSNYVDTSSGDATAAQILNGKKAWVDGAEVTGTMPEIELPQPVISINDDTGEISAYVGMEDQTPGYVPSTAHASNSRALTAKAGGTIKPSAIVAQTWAKGTFLTSTLTVAKEPNLIASNIKSGIQICGVTGNYEASGGESITVDTWPVSIKNNSNSVDTFTIYYINSNSQNATVTCAKGATISINVAVNTYLKVVNSTHRVIYSTAVPSIATCYPILMYGSEYVYWFGDASDRPAQSLTLSSYNYTCNITVDTTDGYGSIGFSYVNNSGTRTDVTVANNTTKTYAVLCGSEIHISDTSGNGIYIYENSYYAKRVTDGTYDAYIAPNVPYATFKMTLSRD